MDVLFTPNSGGQGDFIACPIYEILAEGNRGGGKTDALLWKFVKHCGRGYGPAWRGVIFARKYKQLDEVVARSKKWFFRLNPKPRWLAAKGDYKWIWPTGEELMLRIFDNVDSYWDYHGSELPYIGWEELTRWANSECYDVMKSCSRSSHPGMPRFYVACTNPYGPGYRWVKERFIDPMPRSTVLADIWGNQRVGINIAMDTNIHLLEADPDYKRRIAQDGNQERVKAWLLGSWNIQIGGYFEGAWDDEHNILRRSNWIPPPQWPRWRALDWGYAAPYSVGWYAVDPAHKTIIRYRELYGWGGKANAGTRESAEEVAARVYEIEATERKAGLKFRRCPADPSIWAKMGHEKSIHDYFRERKVQFIPAQGGPGSRVRGWQILAFHMKHKLFQVTEDCHHFLRTVPVLMPDEDDLEDIDTEQEDHAADETRYSIVSRHTTGPIKQAPPPPPKAGTYDWLVRHAHGLH